MPSRVIDRAKLSSGDIALLMAASEALVDVLDGVEAHDIAGDTGLIESRAKEIHEARVNVRNLLKRVEW